ncbi:MAG TPA: thioredoxin domain-containing protein [Blastocatellia bacterium]|nr:thioredoxin domain-containing protein [Blastocatellia bacterium]
MSRGHNARRKAKRQQARAAAKTRNRQSQTDPRRSVLLFPVLAIAAILIATAILGFGAGSGSSQKQINQEVAALLAGIPQHGTTLGSPEARTTLQMFADLECPTVKRFVELHLPSIISTWVRSGAVKIEYRSLKTDTINERTFYRQEEAALAAGRQDKLWNFALTFVPEQRPPATGYATDAFFTRIASQVPDLDMERWNRDREDPSLFKAIALDIRSARIQDLSSTPSFVIVGPADASSVQDEFKSSIEEDIQAIRIEELGDVPLLRVR